MKYSMNRTLPVFLCCLGTGVANAQEVTIFDNPGQYCFAQTQLRGAPEKTILEHHLLVDEEDYFKTGDVFVIARFKSKPDTIYLTNGFYWKKLNDPGPLHVYRTHNQVRDYETLQPVMPITVFYTPMDVTAIEGAVEILVGYGLRAEGENFRVAFDEMVSSERYDVVWDTSTFGVGVRGLSYHICLTTTAMSKELLGSSITSPDTSVSDGAVLPNP